MSTLQCSCAATLKSPQNDHHVALQESSVLGSKHVAALEPLLPPRCTTLWERLLLKPPKMDLRMGARMSDWVCSEISRVFS